MKLGFLKSFSNKKKLKYGSVTIGFCAIVIAIVIVFNSVISVLAESLEWYVDMTAERAYTVSDALAQLAIETAKDAQIDIIFCCSSYKAQNIDEDPTGGMLTYVHSTAQQLSRRMSNVSVLYKDPLNDHVFFKDNGWLGQATRTNVIVARRQADGSYATGERIHAVSQFFSQNENNEIYAYDAEYVFATDLISLCRDGEPYVYVCYGHEESTSTLEFFQLFVDSGFNLVPIFLSDNVFLCENDCDTQFSPATDAEKDRKSYQCPKCKKTYDIEHVLNNLVARPNIPEDARAVIINNPKKDYLDSEISLLRKYLDGQGTVMCFSNPNALESGARLDNLYLFLEEWGGIAVGDEKITDSSTADLNMPNSLRGSVISNNATNTYFPKFTGGSDLRPMFNGATHIDIDNRYIPTATGGYNTGDGERGTLPLIVTSDYAMAGGVRGAYNLMTVTYSETFKTNENDQSNTTNDAYTSYLITCTCPDFIDDRLLGSNSYPNDEIIYSLIRATTAAQVPAYIDPKPIADYSLDMTSASANTSLILLATIPSLAVLGVMSVVLIRRKRR